VIRHAVATSAVAAGTTGLNLGIISPMMVGLATAAPAVARAAHQLHGAIGVTAEYSLHRWTTRLWSGRDWPRSQADWTDRLGRVRAEEEAWRVTGFDRPGG